MKKLVLGTIVTTACLFAAAPAAYQKCAGCHGVKGEKAFVSAPTRIPANLSKADVEKALKGYKDGSYGGAQKMVMKGQAMTLDDAAIKELAEYIGK